MTKKILPRFSQNKLNVRASYKKADTATVIQHLKNVELQTDFSFLTKVC